MRQRPSLQTAPEMHYSTVVDQLISRLCSELDCQQQFRLTAERASVQTQNLEIENVKLLSKIKDLEAKQLEAPVNDELVAENRTLKKHIEKFIQTSAVMLKNPNEK